MAAMTSLLRFRHEQIRVLREGLGLSLRDLASRVGVSHQAVHRWETGEDLPSLAYLLRIINSTGARIESFFEEDTRS